MARIREFLEDIEAEGSYADMNLVFELVKPVEGTRRFSGEVGDMIAVIRKGFLGGIVGFHRQFYPSTTVVVPSILLRIHQTIKVIARSVRLCILTK